jgi:DNA mismatch repair protein MutL
VARFEGEIENSPTLTLLDNGCVLRIIIPDTFIYAFHGLPFLFLASFLPLCIDMPIQPLSDSDIRAIGSLLLLNDARSVIKELIDNALDARADTISIEISANTLDVIQVKDNGSGIGGEDRRLLCKPGCTSKIRTLQDLETLGGSSLGFRGEALASVAASSSVVLVTTRIDGELVGSTSKFSQDGEFLRQALVFRTEMLSLIFCSSSSASHPVGTTIRVQDFLKNIPVRRQTALKAAARTLADTRRIVQAYAFARPNVRITFKVLRAKTDKNNWTYGPNPNSTTLLDATAKIVGQETASQCEARLWTSAGNTYVIDAVIGKGEGGRMDRKTGDHC